MGNFIARLFGKKQVVDAIQTAPLSQEQSDTTIQVQVTRLEPPQLEVGVGQSTGKQRDHNEDSVFVMNAMLTGTTDSFPFGIFIVADGMGGHQYGEVASKTATRVVASYLLRKLYLPYLNAMPDGQSESVQEVMQLAVLEAQQAVTRSVPGGGTTLTVGFIMGEQVTLAHVGDSRAYFYYPEGRLEPVTRDHSLVRRLIELGQITEKEAAVHPQRNVLYRAIGQGEPFDADIITRPMPHPGYLVLCSDGLWGVVPEEDIIRIIKGAESPALACNGLIQAANNNGGPDNISVILVHYPN